MQTGFALFEAQKGEKAANAFPLLGFGSAKVLEIIVDQDGDTYRGVYTVKFAKAVYVLHCFKKKSKRGIATPQIDMDRIRDRLKAAERHYIENYGS